MGKAKATVRAARAEIRRDARVTTDDSPGRTQGALVDRHVGQHTPERLYGPQDDEDQGGTD